MTEKLVEIKDLEISFGSTCAGLEPFEKIPKRIRLDLPLYRP